MRLMKSFSIQLLLLFSIFAANTAFATRILVLTTSETANDAVTIQNNCINEFANSGAVVDVKAGSLNAATLTLADFTPAAGPYDVVVTCTVYKTASPANVAVIDTAAKTRLAQAFFFFDEQLSFFNTVANAKSGWTLMPAGNGGNNTSAKLNTSSPYSGSFTSLNPYGANSFLTYSGVPVNNALYLPPAEPIPSPASPPGTTVRASTILVPTTESYLDGFGVPQGACLFFNTDISGFDSVRYPSLANRIAASFIAATQSGGSCNFPSSIGKTFSPSSTSPGGTSTLIITVNNLTNPAIAVAGLNVTDNLPSPLQISAAPTTTCTGGTLTGTVGGSVIHLSGATLPIGGCTITVPVSWPGTPAGVAACGFGSTITNTITPGTDFTVAGGQVNIPATATLTCNAAGPIAVTKTASATTVVPNAPITYTVTVSNTGTVAASNIVITDMPPADVSGVTWTCAASGGAACPASSGSVSLNETVPSLPGGGVLTYVLNGTVSALPPVSFTNTVSVTPGNALCASGNPAPCTASAAVPPVGMVGIAKTNQGAASVVPNGTVTYDVVVTNPGSVTATGVVVSDPTPAGVTAGTWNCTGTCGTASGNLPLSDTIPSLTSGDSATYRITGTVGASGLPASIVNTASATPGNGGVCTGGVAPPCNSNPVIIPVATTPNPNPGTPIPALTLWTTAALVLLLGGIVAVAYGRTTTIR